MSLPDRGVRHVAQKQASFVRTPMIHSADALVEPTQDRPRGSQTPFMRAFACKRGAYEKITEVGNVLKGFLNKLDKGLAQKLESHSSDFAAYRRPVPHLTHLVDPHNDSHPGTR